MATDSSANLLFKINADAADATANIQQFRSMLSSQLGETAGMFEGWAGKVFGSMTTFKAALLGVGATLAAGTVAAISVMSTSVEKWVSYVSEISKASKLTGIGTEDMSRLAEAAEMVNVPLDAVTRGLGFLYKNISLANQGSEKQIEMFRRQGIGARELAEAEKNPLPILLRLADAFHDNSSAVQKAAIGREEFGRGWADLLPLLSRGSGAIRELGDTINGTSKIVTDKAVVAAREYKIAVRELKEQHEALNYTIGRESLPLLMQWAVAQATAAKMAVEAAKSPMDTLGKMLVANAKGVVSMGLWPIAEFVMGFRAEMAKTEADAKKLAKLGTEKPTGEFLPPETKEAAKEIRQEFYGLSSIIETLRGHMAGLEGDQAKVYQQAQHFRFELQKAEDELFKLAAAGKLAPEIFEREFAAMRALPKMIGEFTGAEIQAITKRRDEMVLAATGELENRLVGLREQSFQNQRAAAEREIRLLIDELKRKEHYTEENAKLVEQIRSGMLAGVDREQLAAFSDTMNRLQAEYAATIASRMTSYGRIASAYDQDVAKFSKAEEEKSLLTANGERTRAQIREWYDLNRQAALNRYGEDLMALRNSQGWQGVFGDFFAQQIRGNEALLRDWSTSGDQAMLMSEVAVESLGNTGRKAFASMAQGMGQSIAQAIVYQKSIGEAMRAAATATLAAIAAESFVQAIYATALGFIRLAQHDYKASAEAFTAAGIFASVGVAAAITGRAIAPKQGGAGAAGGAGEGISGGGTAAGASEAQETRGPRVQIIINGHIIGRQGIDEIAEMINDAVRDRDVPLLASGVKNNTRLLR